MHFYLGNRMPTDGSVTVLVKLLAGGDAEAARPLWDRFFARMVRLARTRLCFEVVIHGEEEDVALSAFDHFCRGAAKNGFRQMENRDDLWKILHMLTSRKARDHFRHATRQKRGRPTVPLDDDVASAFTDPVADAIFDEELKILFDSLDDSELTEVALLKINGHTNEEIARLQNCTVRTVGRRLLLIRSIWKSTTFASCIVE